ncbi:hypothetical protein BDR06DRAFT_973378 [Suillus hirtellus]|nr:hypothetical protein BDR06DRAFT_973378 [Suillus hirtellus]
MSSSIPLVFRVWLPIGGQFIWESGKQNYSHRMCSEFFVLTQSRGQEASGVAQIPEDLMVTRVPYTPSGMYDPTNLEVMHNQTVVDNFKHRPIHHNRSHMSGIAEFVFYKTRDELGDLFLETMWVPNETSRSSTASSLAAS